MVAPVETVIDHHHHQPQQQQQQQRWVGAPNYNRSNNNNNRPHSRFYNNGPAYNNYNNNFRQGGGGGDGNDGPGANLVAPDWAAEELCAVTFDNYVEHPDLSTMTTDEIYQRYKEMEIKVEGQNPPKPILDFALTPFPAWVIQRLAKVGFVKPYPVQSIGWPVVLDNRDIIGIAKTGSGKTLTYILPAIVHIEKQSPLKPGDGPIALMVAPTRELAMQIEKEVKNFTYGSPLQVTCVYGGVPKGKQQLSLRRGVHICIATPGRLLDFVEMETTNLKRVTYFVLDEGDRMLDMGFEPQIRRIMSQIRPERQTLMWSATWPNRVQQLARDLCRHAPIRVTIGGHDLQANENISQMTVVCESHERLDQLISDINQHTSASAMMNNITTGNATAAAGHQGGAVAGAGGGVVDQRKTLVFCETKKSCEHLYRLLRGGGMHQVGVIHGDKEQLARDRTLYEFKNGACDVLVATDVASRGLDIRGIGLVINFDMPKTIECYIHRIGRTGRAENRGVAITYVTENPRLAREIADVMVHAGQQPSQQLIDFIECGDNPFQSKHVGGGGRGGRGGGRGGFQNNRGNNNHHSSSNSFNHSNNNANNNNNFGRGGFTQRRGQGGGGGGTGRGGGGGTSYLTNTNNMHPQRNFNNHFNNNFNNNQQQGGPPQYQHHHTATHFGQDNRSSNTSDNNMDRLNGVVGGAHQGTAAAAVDVPVPPPRTAASQIVGYAPSNNHHIPHNHNDDGGAADGSGGGGIVMRGQGSATGFSQVMRNGFGAQNNNNNYNGGGASDHFFKSMEYSQPRNQSMHPQRQQALNNHGGIANNNYQTNPEEEEHHHLRNQLTTMKEVGAQSFNNNNQHHPSRGDEFYNNSTTNMRSMNANSQSFHKQLQQDNSIHQSPSHSQQQFGRETLFHQQHELVLQQHHQQQRAMGFNGAYMTSPFPNAGGAAAAITPEKLPHDLSSYHLLQQQQQSASNSVQSSTVANKQQHTGSWTAC